MGMRRIGILAFALLLMAVMALTTCAAEEAEDITVSTVVTGYGEEDYSFLTDGLESASVFVEKKISFQNDGGIASMYLVFDFPCGFVVQDLENGRSFTQYNPGYLHVFVDLEEKFGYAPREIAVSFSEPAWFAEARFFSSGEVPDTVQKWQPPLNGSADIVLFSTHGDDEQLYFAGMLPYYAVERDVNVQVVYMTDHGNLSGSLRQHEMLNGLWAVGIRSYPVFGPFPDIKLPSLEKTYAEYENMGFSRENLLHFVVENIRRFKPLVAVGHDLAGEYGHGMHMVYSDLLTQAVQIGSDPEAFPDLALCYGTWDVPKTYLHLYPENGIVMDWDQPLERFDGMTAFAVTQNLGFPCHVSQQYPLYTNWLYDNGNITLASQIIDWSPCYFGLYRSTVGEDVQKNDFMENITPYREIFREADEKEARRRNAVLLAQEAHKKDLRLLRNPQEEKLEKNVEKVQFPAFSILVGLTAIVCMTVLLKKIKYFEKK